MPANVSFKTASEKLELKVNILFVITNGCPLDSAFASLSLIQFEYHRFDKVIHEQLDRIAAISDGKLEWAHGRGQSGLARESARNAFYPHVWSSAHEATRHISLLALEYFFWPLNVACENWSTVGFHELTDEQREMFERILSADRRKALAMTMQEVAQWQERIRRERAILLVQDSSSSEVSATDPAKVLPTSEAHSVDFRSVKWLGIPYEFTPQQAACIKVLWEAFENETPSIGDASILEAAESDAERLGLVFRSHAAWGTMIVEGRTKGTHRLAEPPKS